MSNVSSVCRATRSTSWTAKVYLNGSDTPLDEPYLHEPMELEEPQHYEVPDGCYFMLGDNRNYSNDARRWTHKYVKRDKLVAKGTVPVFSEDPETELTQYLL